MWPLGMIPALFFGALGWRLNQLGLPLRDATIRAGVIAGVWVVAGAELLSLVHALSFWPLLLWWSIPTCIIANKCRRGPRPLWRVPEDRISRALLGAGALLLALTFIGAAFAPPNNWDSLSYHLPRQVYWIQQHSVANFPANDWRMLAMPPLSEFAGAQLMILSGGDRWSSLPQWLAFALTAVAASAIARDLGCSGRLQAAAALLVLTIPPAVMECMVSKNDLVAAFFFCTLIYQGLKIYQTRNSAPSEIALVGAACGLLVLAKGTGMIFAIPAALWIAAIFFSRMPFKRALASGAFTSVIILLINFGHLLRCQVEFGSPLGPNLKDNRMAVGNRLHTAPAFLSNLARNTAMHLATPSTNINAALQRGVVAFHDRIGLGVSDRRTTFALTPEFKIKPRFTNENIAAAPIHLLLALAVFIPIIWNLIRSRDKVLASLALIPYVGYVLFCWLIAWQQWGSRLQIPLFSLAAPIIVYTVGRRWPRLLAGGTALAFALAAFSVLMVESKPLVGKKNFLTRTGRLRYLGHEWVRPGLTSLKAVCRQQKPATVGIVARPNGCEYFVLWNLLHGEFPAPRIQSMKLAGCDACAKSSGLDMVIGWHVAPGETNAVFDQAFTLVTNVGPVYVYLPRR